MAPWEMTGKVRGEERGRRGVRKLPVPGAGWVLQKPKESSERGGSRDRWRDRERNAHWERTHRT